jgi:signal transduction histidine kinase
MLEERSRSGIFLGEISIKHKDGHFIPTEITSINMKDAQGNTYHSNIIRDITEKKKIEEEQQSLTQELIKNNQDLQQFSFITSHNLRAPVANLISILNLYDKKKPEDEFNQLLIEKFEEATLQLNSTLNDLINVLVIKSNTNVDKQDLVIDNVLSEVRKGIDNLLLENKGVITSDFSEVNIIKYNRIHLESIFLNLLTNAIRYRSAERKPGILIRSYREGKWIVVSFKDNGLGIDLKRYGDRLFGLYQRFHESKEGKGLGLYMVNSQVVAMGGKIEVESEPGKGSTFKVYFKS